jgi:hypothetical protein
MTGSGNEIKAMETLTLHCFESDTARFLRVGVSFLSTQPICREAYYLKP